MDLTSSNMDRQLEAARKHWRGHISAVSMRANEALFGLHVANDTHVIATNTQTQRHF